MTTQENRLGLQSGPSQQIPLLASCLISSRRLRLSAYCLLRCLGPYGGMFPVDEDSNNLLWKCCWKPLSAHPGRGMCSLLCACSNQSPAGHAGPTFVCWPPPHAVPREDRDVGRECSGRPTVSSATCFYSGTDGFVSMRLQPIRRILYSRSIKTSGPFPRPRECMHGLLRISLVAVPFHWANPDLQMFSADIQG